MPNGKRNLTHQKLKTPCAAALAGIADLRAGPGAVAEHYLKPVGHVDFSGMGRRGQRLHPPNESAQPLINAVTHAPLWRVLSTC